MVLSVMPIGEYDRRIEILSAGLGRISAFARGARKPGSPLMSIGRVFAFGEFTLHQGKNSYTVQSVKIQNYFEELVHDMDLVYYGFYFVELAQYFSRENLEARDMLKLLYYGLRALGSDSVKKELVRSIVELKMLAINGLCPSVDRLTSGTGSYLFGASLSRGCIHAFSHVTEMPVEKVFSFVLSPDVQGEFADMVQRLLRQSVDRQFKSEKLLEPLQGLSYNDA